MQLPRNNAAKAPLKKMISKAGKGIILENKAVPPNVNAARFKRIICNVNDFNFRFYDSTKTIITYSFK